MNTIDVDARLAVQSVDDIGMLKNVLVVEVRALTYAARGLSQKFYEI